MRRRQSMIRPRMTADGIFEQLMEWFPPGRNKTVRPRNSWEGNVREVVKWVENFVIIEVWKRSLEIGLRQQVL